MRLLWLLVAIAIGLAWGGDPLPAAVLRALGAPSRKAEVAILEEAVATTTDPAMLPWILLYAGEARRLNGEPGLARAHFERVAGEWPAHRAKNPSVLGLAVVDAGEVPSGNQRATLELVADDNVPDTLNAERYLLLARALSKDGASADKVAAALERARTYAQGDKEVSRRIAREAMPAAEAPPLPTGPADLQAIEAIRAALAAGRLDQVRSLAGGFATAHPDSPYVREAGYALRRAELGTTTVANRVAVLLPLTGDLAKPAGDLRAAIELANERSGKAELQFLDTAGKPEQCVALAEKAVLERGAALLIGPLKKEEAAACAPAAQALRVPMVTLTSSAETLAVGDHVFHTFPSPESQVAALVEEVRNHRVIPRFAVLHPRTAYGENATRVFTELVTKAGGSVVRTGSYPADTSDFRKVIQPIGKPAGATAVDYDALFVPDAYQRVALLASAVAYAEIPIGRFRPRSGDVPVTLLGLAAWNNDELARRGGQYVEDCIFVDAFDPRSPVPEVRAFVEAWEARGQGPPSVVEAVGYDTMLLAAAALGHPDGAQAGLLGARPLGTLTGLKGFASTRDAERSWQLLTVRGGGVTSLYGDLPTP